MKFIQFVYTYYECNLQQSCANISRKQTRKRFSRYHCFQGQCHPSSFHCTYKATSLCWVPATSSTAPMAAVSWGGPTTTIVTCLAAVLQCYYTTNKNNNKRVSDNIWWHNLGINTFCTMENRWPELKNPVLLANVSPQVVPMEITW